MTTKLDTPLKRELMILGKPYTLVISPNGLALTPKGKRKGYELEWVDLVSGDAALAVALNASLARGPKPEPAPAKAPPGDPPHHVALPPPRRMRGSATAYIRSAARLASSVTTAVTTVSPRTVG